MFQCKVITDLDEEKIVLSAKIYNLLNEDYAQRADFNFANYRYLIGPPRRIFLTATWQWAQESL